MCLDKHEVGSDGGSDHPSNGGNVVESTKSLLFDLMYGRVVDDAYGAFLRYYGKLPEDEVEVKDFEEKLEAFKMANPTIRYVLY